LTNHYAVLGGFVAGPQSLLHFAGDAAVNTDDHPTVAYTAPRITYAPVSQARDRLLTLLGELQVAPEELLSDTADGDFRRRLAAYWRARDLFLAAGRGVRPSADVKDMLAQVREPLLAVLRTSADFRPAEEPLRRMASVLARTDALAARTLLDELDRIQGAPAR
jgi:spermidine synthase